MCGAYHDFSGSEVTRRVRRALARNLKSVVEILAGTAKSVNSLPADNVDDELVDRSFPGV